MEKKRMIKIQERLLWALVVGLAAFHILGKSHETTNLRTILDTYAMESEIQEAQLNDLSQYIDEGHALEYQRGFEEGRTQAGVALAQGGSLYDYTDGYHAAMSQVSDEAHLDVAESILTELANLRKMVPRLLNQVNKLTEENQTLQAFSYDSYLLDSLLELNVNADLTYLEIIELLTSEKVDTEEFQVD